MFKSKKFVFFRICSLINNGFVFLSLVLIFVITSSPAFPPRWQVRLHLQPPMESSGVFYFNSNAVIIGLGVINQSFVDFIAYQKCLNSPHSHHELNELTNEHREHTNWRLNQVEYCDDGVCKSEVHRVLCPNKGCE